MLSPDNLLRTQFAIFDDAMRIKLSPWLRASIRVPQTQSKNFSAVINFGASAGSFCKSASSVTINFPRAAFIPAQSAADCPQSYANFCARIFGSAAASSFETVQELSVLQSSVKIIS